jgi:pimeloyl-ACP methyl ester carboxylesterase
MDLIALRTCRPRLWSGERTECLARSERGGNPAAASVMQEEGDRLAAGRMVSQVYEDGPSGLQVAYAKAGDGRRRATLVVHPRPCRVGQFTGLLDALSARHRTVVALDAPSLRGGSAPGDEISASSPANVALRLLASIDVTEVCVLGYQSGADIGLEMAAASPERVLALILVAVSGQLLREESSPQPLNERITEVRSPVLLMAAEGDAFAHHRLRVLQRRLSSSASISMVTMRHTTGAMVDDQAPEVAAVIDLFLEENDALYLGPRRRFPPS